MRKKLQNLIQNVRCAMKNVNCAHNIIHAMYFGMVAYEAHHWYGIAAGLLLVITLVELGSDET